MLVGYFRLTARWNDTELRTEASGYVIKVDSEDGLTWPWKRPVSKPLSWH